MMFQPGSRDGTIQCFIKRDKSKLTYHLFLCLSPGENLCNVFDFLLWPYCSLFGTWKCIKFAKLHEKRQVL